MAEYKLYNLKDPKTGQEEPQISSKEEFDAIKQKVPTSSIKNPRTGQEGSAESVVKEGDMNPGDGRNVAMEIAKCLRDALREHGDQMKAVFLSDSTNEGATIKIQYMPDEQGQADEDEFTFRWGDGTLRLDNVANPVELCQLQKQSGTVNIQKDLVKANLLKFLQSHDKVDSSDTADPNALPDGPVAEEQLWESDECQQAFCDAVDMYRKAKDKESIKNLFRAARPYQKGNTIQEKLKGAVDWYNIYTQKPPKNTKEQVFLEDSDVDTQNILQSVSDSLSELRRLQETDKVDSSSVKKAVFHLKEAFNLLQELENISEENNQPDWDYGLSWDDLDIREQEESNVPSVTVALQKLSEGLQILKEYNSQERNDDLEYFIKKVSDSYSHLLGYVKYKFEYDDLNEFIDLNDPIANGEPNNYGGGDPRDFDNDERNREWEDYDDEPVVSEEDEWGPEVGDDINYEGGHYKLYGYCGYEVVLQNVDDERDFKVVKPESVGVRAPQKDLKETNWVDPDELPDNETQRV